MASAVYYAAPPKEEVDFMAMFTNQHEESLVDSKPTTQQQPAEAVTATSEQPQVYDLSTPVPYNTTIPSSTSVPQYLEPALTIQSTSSNANQSAQYGSYGTVAPLDPSATSTEAQTIPGTGTLSPTAITASPTLPGSGGATPSETPVATADKTQIRRKRKLTPDDKRRICEIYRNSQGKIRQEDIAKEYSVDRSTISKILNQEDRWLDPQQPNAAAILARRPGGRYPAIEEEMHRWLDDAVMQGRDVRDSEAREEALKVGLRLGHPHFQASSKWWDGVKRRRIEEGRPMPNTRRPHTSMPPLMPGLIRSYSTMTMDFPREVFPIAGPSHHQYMIDPAMMHPGVMGVPLQHAGLPMAVRARSQSSPQMFHPYAAQQQPSFGPAPRQRQSPGRPSPVTPLTRHRSYQGSNGGSPQRGSPLHRGVASHASARPSPHIRLGASAFGITPFRPEDAPPIGTPVSGGATPTEGTPTGSASAPASTAGGAAPPVSMSPLSMAVSDTPSDLSNGNSLGLSPSTPCTPAQASFPQVPDYMTAPAGPDMMCQQQQQQQHVMMGQAGMMQFQPVPMYTNTGYPGDFQHQQWQ